MWHLALLDVLTVEPLLQSYGIFSESNMDYFYNFFYMLLIITFLRPIAGR